MADATNYLNLSTINANQPVMANQNFILDKKTSSLENYYGTWLHKILNLLKIYIY